MNSAETEKKSEPANAMGAARFLLFLVLVVVTTWLFLPVSLLGFICLCSFIVLVIKVQIRVSYQKLVWMIMQVRDVCIYGHSTKRMLFLTRL